MTTLTQRTQWQALADHQQEISNIHLRDLFKNDSQRAEKFSLEAANLVLDYSKNHIDEITINLLSELAIALGLPQKITALFNGEKVNTTEQLPALHTALRDPNKNTESLEKMVRFCETIHQQKQITDIVTIGIGGSDLGPRLGVEALTPYATSALLFHFVNNIDPSCIALTLKKLNPANTLFIISSKSFSTIETLTNAKIALDWFNQNNINVTTQNFIAITSKPNLAKQFGITEKNIFTIEDGVGGRYSLWSAIGLPIMLAIGAENFKKMLAGAYAMDQHFLNTPLQQNMPVILGMLNIWYNNFFSTRAHAILPYAQSLQQLPSYLQQAEMESTGKHVTQNGDIANYATGQIIFGAAGTNGQHSFYQLLHQGTQLIPVDFIVPMRSHYGLENQQAILVANAFAQSKALAEGKMQAEVLAETYEALLAPHKTLTGNRPSNIILMSQLTPYTFGALLALYEHKIFVQSVILQINAFDQWGVELGKQLANDLLPKFTSDKNIDNDQLVQNLVKYYRYSNQ